MLIATSSFAQWNPSSVWWSFNDINEYWAFNPAKQQWDYNEVKQKWDYNPIDYAWKILYANAIEEIAGNVGTGANMTAKILDTYPCLYGIKELWTGTGDSCVRLHRDSDSTQQTFGFLASGYVDTISINTFLSGTTGRVIRWVDQSGNDNTAIQNTIADMPLWHNTSGIMTDGTSDYMTNLMGTFNQPNTFITIGLLRNSTGQTFNSNSSGNQEILYSDGSTWKYNAGSVVNYTTNDDMTYISIIFNGASSFGLFDGTKQTGDAGSNAIRHLNISCAYGEDSFSENDFKSFVVSQYGFSETQCNLITDFLNE